MKLSLLRSPNRFPSPPEAARAKEDGLYSRDETMSRHTGFVWGGRSLERAGYSEGYRARFCLGAKKREACLSSDPGIRRSPLLLQWSIPNSSPAGLQERTTVAEVGSPA